MKHDFVERRVKEPWHLDKKIPITLIFVIILQTSSFIVWAAKLDSRVEDHERRIVQGEIFDREYSKANSDILQRMTRVEEKLTAQLASLERIEVLVRDHMNNGRGR